MTETRLSSSTRDGLRIVGRGALAALVALPLAVAAEGPPAGVSPEEWTGIEQQIDAERHEVTESDRPGRLWRAANPAQRFTAHFGTEDVLLVPAGRGEPAWQLGLRLTAWGAAHDLQPVPPAGAIADGNRVEFLRGPLTEWYVNTAIGLEQGFTIDHPPGDDIDELVLEMTLDGDLTPMLAETGQAATFRYADSNTALTYAGLKAWDAVEEPLEAHMELHDGGERLRLVVEVARAVWPVTVDPIFTQVAKLLPTPQLDNTDAHFGRSVAIDNDVMAVAIYDVVSGERADAVYVFHRDRGGPGEWTIAARLLPENGRPLQLFGRSIAVSGETVVIGAPVDDLNGAGSGSVYVFSRDHGGPDRWGRVAILTADDGGFEDALGSSVAISGDTVVAGASGDGDNGPFSGSAYIFRLNHGNPESWAQMAKLTASDGAYADFFGCSVDIDGDTVIVGAFGDDDHGSVSGSAYIFHGIPETMGSWEQTTKLTADDGDGFDHFGEVVSISGENAFVAAPEDDGIRPNSGSVYVFNRNEGGTDNWGQKAKLAAPDGPFDRNFGRSIASDATTVIIGSNDNEIGASAGAAYVFALADDGTNEWMEIAKITAGDGQELDFFGTSVAISNEVAVVGSPQHDGAFPDSGSVYAFDTMSWDQVSKISSPPVYSAWRNHFGQSVDISAGIAVIAAPNNPIHGSGFGAVYVFQRERVPSYRWKLASIIAPVDGSPGDGFGTSVAVSSDLILVGAPFDSSNGVDSGAAYVFERDRFDPTVWREKAILRPSNPWVRDFGAAVAIEDTTAIVGSPGKSSGHGSAYVFQRDLEGTGDWRECAILTPLDPGGFDDWFGSSVAISGDTVIIGEPLRGPAYVFQRNQDDPDIWVEIVKITDAVDAKEVAIDGDTAMILGEQDTVHIHHRNQNGPDHWGRVASIAGSECFVYCDFGESIALNGNIAIIGAPGDGLHAHKSGSVFIFQREEPGSDTWTETSKITTVNGVTDDQFGTAVAFNGDTVLVGTPFDDEAGQSAGSTYVFFPYGPRSSAQAPRRVIPQADP